LSLLPPPSLPLLPPRVPTTSSTLLLLLQPLLLPQPPKLLSRPQRFPVQLLPLPHPWQFSHRFLPQKQQ
jgi:hypothetical protein